MSYKKNPSIFEEFKYKLNRDKIINLSVKEEIMSPNLNKSKQNNSIFEEFKCQLNQDKIINLSIKEEIISSDYDDKLKQKNKKNIESHCNSEMDNSLTNFSSESKSISNSQSKSDSSFKSDFNSKSSGTQSYKIEIEKNKKNKKVKNIAKFGLNIQKQIKYPFIDDNKCYICNKYIDYNFEHCQKCFSKIH